ncbi:2,3-dihydroxybenzoate-AMP ligase, partial [Pseudomonas syringae pv. tagetis]
MRCGDLFWATDIDILVSALPDFDSGVVVAVPDSVLGERICAFFQCDKPTAAAQHIRDQLPLHGLGENS